MIKGYLTKFSFDGEFPFHHSSRNSTENKIYVALDHDEPFLPKKLETDLRRIVEQPVSDAGAHLLEKVISATYLIHFARPGKDAALDFSELRLASIMAHRMEKGADYYLSSSEKKKYGVPRRYLARPILSPIFDPYVGISPLPMIHDLYLLRAVAVNTGKPSSHQARIVRHVLSEAYQNELLSGYGYSYFVNTGTVYSTGWSCHLGTKEDDRGIAPSSILPRLIMLSAFGEARRSAWFAKAKRFLIATYHNRSGVLPSPLLIERSQGYWVEGAFMSFGDTLNSRTRTNIAIQRLQQIGVSDKELKATR